MTQPTTPPSASRAFPPADLEGCRIHVGSGGANCPPEVYKTIDLGCGENKVEGAIGVDEAALPGVDVVHDLLSFPYPFGENRAEEVYLRNVLEHFALSDIRKILREVHRMLLPGGVVHIHVPHVFSVAGWADPTHRTWFTFVSGEFFDTGSAKAYYKGFDSIWDLAGISSRVTWFNWKRYRLRRLDDWLSSQMAAFLDRLLKSHTWPGAADLFVRVCPMFFVEIRWQLRKPLNK